MAALLVSWDFSKPSEPQRRRTPRPRTAASGTTCAGPLVRRADRRAALPMCATSEPVRSAGPSRLSTPHWSRPSPGLALASPRLLHLFPVRVVVDQVVTVNRGVRLISLLETGSTGTFPRWQLNRGL